MTVSEIFLTLTLQLVGYSCSMVLGNLIYACTFELYHEFNNITLNSLEMKGIILTLLKQKLDAFQICYVFAVFAATMAYPKLCETTFLHFDFYTVVIVTIVMMIASRTSAFKETSYKHFIRNSGLDCGSFMAYSFYRGYIKYVIASNSDVSSKGLVERINDYEAKHNVSFPIKKLFILQPQSMNVSPTLTTETLQNAENLEEVKLNVGGVVGRSYQMSVYKINGPNWYVNVQTASPLLTYYLESKCSELLEKYRSDVAQSFRRHLERLIWEDLGCRGLVELIYYNDLDDNEEPIDVGVVLKKHIEESLKKKA